MNTSNASYRLCRKRRFQVLRGWCLVLMCSPRTLRAAALREDAVLDASVGGFGGCPFAPRATGNIATEDLLWQLDRSEQDHTSLDFPALLDLATWLSGRLEKPAQSLLSKSGWFPQ